MQETDLEFNGPEDTSASSDGSMLLEAKSVEGPPKEDCTLYNLNDLPGDQVQEIKNLIVKSAGPVCKNAINGAYAAHSVQTASAVLVAMQSTYSTETTGLLPFKGFAFGQHRSESVRICGFVTLKEKPGSVHVDLLCSHMGYGKIMLEQSELYSTTVNKPYTDLEAVVSARGFYEKVGYRHCADPCSTKCKDVPVKTNNGFLMKKCLDATLASTPCGQGPCKQALDACNDVPESAGDGFTKKKCIDATIASSPCSGCMRPLEIASTGNRVMQDVTPFFAGKKQLETEGKTFRCCCRLMNICHLVVEGRDELPLAWRTGLGGCGKYIANTHSWNHWTEGKCRIDLDSLAWSDYAVFNPVPTDSIEATVDGAITYSTA